MGKHTKAIPCGMLAAALVISANSWATVINVPADQPTIQAGISAATNGDTVLVAPGTYNESVYFQFKAITLRSSGGSDLTTINAAGGNTSAVFINSNAGQSSVQGFTITGGSGALSGDTRFGGGVRVTIGANALLIDCKILNNTASGVSGRGGGVDVTGSATMRQCVIAGNVAAGVGGPFSTGGSGGGVHSIAGDIVMIDCQVIGNSATGSGGFEPVGAAGGGLWMGGSGSAVLINCEFRDNSATIAAAQGSTGGGGGGIRFNATTAILVNCRITNNQSSAVIPWPGILGGAMNLSNCTIANNMVIGAEPPGTCGGMLGAGATAIYNSIIYGNAGQQLNGPTDVQFSCVQGGYAGRGNIGSDPLFLDPANGDFHLADGSPCIDTASLAHVQADAFDLDADGNMTERVPFDLAGLRRVVNGFVDMGAYEWQHECSADVSPSSPGVAGDGTVNIGDLLAIIGSWAIATHAWRMSMAMM
ncbi:MAG: DUF5123 domain-containing protein [Phycisphaerales bacterium]|nr:DUF5123 domain-containing protein [Phycisphaerales bacterium]